MINPPQPTSHFIRARYARWLLAAFLLTWLLASRSSSRLGLSAGPIHIVRIEHIRDVVRAVPDDLEEQPIDANFTAAEEQLAGACYAGSAIKDHDATGGFGPCNNMPKQVRASSSGRGLFLLAQPNVATQMGKRSGMRLVLVNQTADRLAFDAQDSRLCIVQEAMNHDGVWQPIEYLWQSRCGNSYHRVFLESQQFWAFAVPRYAGSFPTKLRFRLKLDDDLTIYSNEFEGSIHPRQFENLSILKNRAVQTPE